MAGPWEPKLTEQAIAAMRKKKIRNENLAATLAKVNPNDPDNLGVTDATFKDLLTQANAPAPSAPPPAQATSLPVDQAPAGPAVDIQAVPMGRESFSSQTGKKEFNPEYLAKANAAEAEANRYRQMADDAEAEANLAKQTVYEGSGAAFDEAQKTYQSEMGKLTNAANARIKTMGELDAQTKDMSINPNRLYEGSGGTVNKILAAVAMGLGGFAHGFSGGKVQNQGMMLVNEAIDRDIMAQKAAFEMAQQKRQNLVNDYSRILATKGDARQAYSILKAQMLDDLSREAMVKGMKATDNKARYNLMMTSKLAEMQKNLEMAKDTGAYTQDTTTKGTEMEFIPQQGGGGLRAKPLPAPVMSKIYANMDVIEKLENYKRLYLEAYKEAGGNLQLLGSAKAAEKTGGRIFAFYNRLVDAGLEIDKAVVTARESGQRVSVDDMKYFKRAKEGAPVEQVVRQMNELIRRAKGGVGSVYKILEKNRLNYDMTPFQSFEDQFNRQSQVIDAIPAGTK